MGEIGDFGLVNKLEDRIALLRDILSSDEEIEKRKLTEGDLSALRSEQSLLLELVNTYHGV